MDEVETPLTPHDQEVRRRQARTDLVDAQAVHDAVMDEIRLAYVGAGPEGPSAEVSADLTRRLHEAQAVLSAAKVAEHALATASPKTDYFTWSYWPDSEKGPMRVGVYFDELDGEPVCVGIEVWSRNPPATRSPVFGRVEERPHAIDSALWRSLPVGRLLRESGARQQAFADRLARLCERLPDGQEDEAASMREAAAEIRRVWQGTKRYPNTHFAEVAAVYEAHRADRPTKSVSEKFGVPKSTAAKWVARARSLGYLEPTTRGRAR